MDGVVYGLVFFGVTDGGSGGLDGGVEREALEVIEVPLLLLARAKHCRGGHGLRCRTPALVHAANLRAATTTRTRLVSDSNSAETFKAEEQLL